MASKTYHEHIIVLKKTKLKESDLIVTMLAEDGRQVRAVAKGARKPTSSFASRMELFTASDVLLVVGRNLEIVKEARIVSTHAALRSDLTLTACAAPIAELLEKTTQADLPVPRLFDMTQSAFDRLGHASGLTAPLLTCAYLLKCVSLLGFRPSMDACVECGDNPFRGNPVTVGFSAPLGGVLCEDCAADRDIVVLDAQIARWCVALLNARFDEVLAYEVDASTTAALLRFIHGWIREYIGNLKSMAFLLSEAEALQNDTRNRPI